MGKWWEGRMKGVGLGERGESGDQGKREGKKRGQKGEWGLEREDSKSLGHTRREAKQLSERATDPQLGTPETPVCTPALIFLVCVVVVIVAWNDLFENRWVRRWKRKKEFVRERGRTRQRGT